MNAEIARVDDLPVHRIRVKTGVAAGVVKDGLEQRGIHSTTKPDGDGWAIDFRAPIGFDVDWLRPHILPPRTIVPLPIRPCPPRELGQR